MQRIVFAATGLALAGLWMSANTDRGRAQTHEPGPGPGGSVLKDPYAPPAPTNPAPGTANYVETLINPTLPASPFPNPAQRYLRPPEEKPDINQDIQVTEGLDPWVILVHAYTTPEASIMARQLVFELRKTYNLPAYTFNFGAEERRKEFERVKALVEKQKEYLAKNGLPLDSPIRIRTMRIEEQVGVLVGGYKTEDAARRALDGMRKLKMPDPDKVMLDKRVVYGEDRKKDYKTPTKAEKIVEGYVNPFETAFVAHNPKIKQERPADWDKPDMALLQKLNAGESFSLLNCKKPYTLAVKDFQTPTVVQTKSSTGTFLDNLLGGKTGQREDAAATSAHNLAELLRKVQGVKLDAYVLHTKYTSVVTVGNFEKDDPNMQVMANLIETKIMPQISRLFPPPPNQAMVQARAVPMQIPR